MCFKFFFAECKKKHSANKLLYRVSKKTLGKETFCRVLKKHSAKSLFAECKKKHSAKASLLSARKTTLGKPPGTRQRAGLR